MTTDRIRTVAAFARLSEPQLAAVERAARPVQLAAGARLFEEGQAAAGCWLLTAGHVALTTDVPGREPMTVQTLGPGDLLGWSWLVPPHHWHFTATATTPVEALELDTGALRELAEQDPGFGYPLACGLFEVLLARLQSTRARLLDVYRSPRER